ncbi:unnamed protein product [Boreogadus saida]
MSRKKLAWANKEVETFVCILGEEDVVYDVYVAAAAIDIRPTTKGTVGSGNATSELRPVATPQAPAPGLQPFYNMSMLQAAAGRYSVVAHSSRLVP